MGPCDIKTSAKAWNDGVDAFKKAFQQTGGKTNESIKFAIDEINKNNPELNFDVKSFVDPLIASLKKNGVIAQSYNFKPANAASIEGKINKVAEKMTEMSQDEKKAFARKAFIKFQQDGMLDEQGVKNIYADALGMPAMNDKMDAQIKSSSEALIESKNIEDEIASKIKEMQADKDANGGKLTPAQNASYQSAFNALGAKRSAANKNTMKQSAAMANMLIEKKFWLHQLTDYMPLNLMNPNSLAKNISGAIADAYIRTIGNTIASPISELLKFATGINSNPIGAKLKGALKSKAKEKASLAWKHGQTDFNSEIPQSNHLNSTLRFRQAMDQHGFETFKGIISAALKVHPDLISKGLTVPDAIVYEMVHSGEINRIAESKGLKGAEKEAFILSPDEKSLEIAKTTAETATFKQGVPKWLTSLSGYNPHEQSKKKIAAGMSPLAVKIKTGLTNVVLKSAVPFIKTPINIVRVASKVLLPEYELGSALMKAKKETDATERQKLIVEGTSRFVAGMAVRYVAIQMLAQGLISAGYDDEDKKTKDIVEQEAGGPNRINYSALMRGLTFRGVTKQKGDTYVDLSALGAFGIVMATYAHAYNKNSKDDIKNKTDYSKNLLKVTADVPFKLIFSGISAAMDFTFFTGINQLNEALMDNEDNNYKANKLAGDYIANMFTGVLPATYQKFSTQSDPNVKRQFNSDLSFRENLENTLGYRFFFQSEDLKNKYFSLNKEGGPKKKHYMLFDSYLGRVLEAQFDFTKTTKLPEGDNPISRLYETMREVKKDERDRLFPASVGKNQSMTSVVRGTKHTYKVDLTDAQHEYLQDQASKYRMIMVTPFIMSDDFKNADFEIKTKALQSLYADGLKMAKKDFKVKYPDIKSQEIEGSREAMKKAKKMIKKYKTKELK